MSAFATSRRQSMGAESSASAFVLLHLSEIAVMLIKNVWMNNRECECFTLFPSKGLHGLGVRNSLGVWDAHHWASPRKNVITVSHPSDTTDFTAVLVRSVFSPSIGFEQQNG